MKVSLIKQKNKISKSLDLMRKFEDICGKNIAKQMRDNVLQTLCVPGGRPFSCIDPMDMSIIIDELSKNTSITQLILAENRIYDQTLKGIGALKNITSLDLSNNELTDDCLVHLKEMEQLCFLNLGGTNNFSEKALSFIFEYMKNLKTLVVSGIDASAIDPTKVPKCLELFIDEEIFI